MATPVTASGALRENATSTGGTTAAITLMTFGSGCSSEKSISRTERQSKTAPSPDSIGVGRAPRHALTTTTLLTRCVSGHRAGLGRDLRMDQVATCGGRAGTADLNRLATSRDTPSASPRKESP